MTATLGAAVAEAAGRLRTAAVEHAPCAPVRDLIGSSDLVAAYAVQRSLTQARLAAGATVVGRKIGLTSDAVQHQLGVDRPDFGVLFDDMEVADGALVPLDRLLQPQVEAEIAFVLGSDLDDDVSAIGVRRAVEYAVPALEIVDSRIAGWDISLADTVADNASSGLFVLGTPRHALADLEPRETRMTLAVDGTVVSTGTGEACLGDPLAALAWLAATALELGDPLRAGQVVLSGALGPMVAVRARTTVRAELHGADHGPVGQVTAVFPAAP
jgi:2-keto-4-pentenoate hydratase